MDYYTRKKTCAKVFKNLIRYIDLKVILLNQNIYVEISSIMGNAAESF